jgi:spire-like protein
LELAIFPPPQGLQRFSPIYFLYHSLLFPQLVQSLGVAIYQALDWGLDDSEERELSPQLERLIERMAGGDHSLQADSGSGNGTTDEGYSGQEEEEEEGEKGAIRPVCTFSQVMTLCTSRLANPVLAPEHYQAVCRALFVETLELQTFLIKIRNAKEVCSRFVSVSRITELSCVKL